MCFSSDFFILGGFLLRSAVQKPGFPGFRTHSVLSPFFRSTYVSLQNRSAALPIPAAFSYAGSKKLDFTQILCYILFMPKVFEIYGYKFFFFSNEGNPLEPCHIHVRKNGNLAKFWIKENAELADNIGFSSSELKNIQEILNEKKLLVKEAWNEFFKRKR